MLKITWWMEVESEIEGPCVWPQSLFPLHGSTWPSSRYTWFHFQGCLFSLFHEEGGAIPGDFCRNPVALSTWLSPLSSLSRWSFFCASNPFLPSSLKFLVLPLILSFQYCIFVYHSHLPFLKQVLPLNAFFQKGQGIMFLAFIVTSVKVVIIWGCNPHPKCCL